MRGCVNYSAMLLTVSPFEGFGDNVFFAQNFRRYFVGSHFLKIIVNCDKVNKVLPIAVLSNHTLLIRKTFFYRQNKSFLKSFMLFIKTDGEYILRVNLFFNRLFPSVIKFCQQNMNLSHKYRSNK